MNENLNLVEILKDCPEGTKLYSTIFGEVEFEGVHSGSHTIGYTTRTGRRFDVTREGKIFEDYDGEGTLFPSKDQRDWSKFTAPWYKKDKIEPKFKIGNWYQCTKSFYGKGVIFTKNTAYYCAQKGCLQDEYGCHIAIVKDLYDNFKLWTIQDAKDGDVLAISWWEDENFWEKIIIFKKYHNEGVKGLYGMPCVEGYGNTFKNGKIAFTDEKVPSYSKTWTRNLRPATKVQRDVLMKAMNDAGYKWNAETKTLEKLVEPKFDPKTLQPFDKVLVRDNYKEEWSCNFFSHISNDDVYHPYITLNIGYIFCIPYNEDTKHLVGTKEEAPEYYRYWED